MSAITATSSTALPSLPAGENAAEQISHTTDWRLDHYSGDAPDIGLETLLFQYGRDPLIASSRRRIARQFAGQMEQQQQSPPWRCDYHTDVNVEMNYWAADAGNLGECFQPFADWINSIRAVRTEATRQAFHVRGWVMRGESGPFGGSTWEWTPGTTPGRCRTCTTIIASLWTRITCAVSRIPP